MPYNDNQLFYATLYWTEALPGGKAFTAGICASYGKSYIPMDVPQQTSQSIDWNNFCGSIEEEDAIETLIGSSVARAQCEDFFEAMYSFLKHSEEKERTARSGKFIKLSRGIASVNGAAITFSNAIEHALEVAHLPREVLNREAALFLHDNGLIFFTPEGIKTSRDVKDMAYPGRPDTGYRTLPDFTTEEGSRGLPLVSIEYFYRVIELEAGKTYTPSYISTTGERVSYDFEAQEGDIYYIAHNQVEGGLGELSDEEIMSGKHPRVNGGCQCHKWERDQFEPGYVSETYGYRNEATDDPRIIRQLQASMRCMEVTEKLEISWGYDFQRLEPGDKILFNDDMKRVIPTRKADIDSGRVRLVDVSIGHDAVLERQQRLRNKNKNTPKV